MTEEEIGVLSTLKQDEIIENAGLKRWGWFKFVFHYSTNMVGQILRGPAGGQSREPLNCLCISVITCSLKPKLT